MTLYEQYSPVFQEAAESEKEVQEVLDQYGHEIERGIIHDLIAKKVDIAAKVRSLQDILEDPSVNKSQRREEAERKSVELARVCWDAKDFCRNIRRQFMEGGSIATKEIGIEVPGLPPHCIILESKRINISGKQYYPVFHIRS